ncbi:hypothetical protein I4U23_030247 [Adineta vaga]|nr:hypothetical protein I4U23_030247 [Adineta vaga]
MVRTMDPFDMSTEYKYDQTDASMSPNLTPTSPLDLTINSKRFVFTQQSTSPVDLSMKRTTVYEKQISVEKRCEPPKIIIEPKSEWHYRSMKDLSKNHLPFLAGSGRQRTPIRVSVPSASKQEMFLGIALLTMKYQPHPSKVIVPAKTTVNNEHLTHDNNLQCLRFDENSTDYFDSETRCIFSKISHNEHHIGSKDVRVHMFNLYQNQTLTKDLIEIEQLNLCKLCFWFCVRKNGQYVSISQPSLSVIIEEKKMSNRSRPSDLMKSSSPQSTTSSQSDTSRLDETSIDDDDDIHSH